MSNCDFRLVVLKGVIEKGDGTAYFGSLISYAYYRRGAVRLGLLRLKRFSPSPDCSMLKVVATPLGRRLYQESGLAKLPQIGRGYSWDWAMVKFEENKPTKIAWGIRWTSTHGKSGLLGDDDGEKTTWRFADRATARGIRASWASDYPDTKYRIVRLIRRGWTMGEKR